MKRLPRYEYKVTSYGIIDLKTDGFGNPTRRHVVEPREVPTPEGEGWEPCGFCYGEDSLWWTWRREVAAPSVVCPYCERSQLVNGDRKVRKHINPRSNKTCSGSGRAASAMEQPAEGSK